MYQLYEAPMASAPCVRNWAASGAKTGMSTAKLSPFVSMKSCLVMEVGSMWCSRNGRMNACQTQPHTSRVTVKVDDCNNCCVTLANKILYMYTYT